MLRRRSHLPDRRRTDRRSPSPSDYIRPGSPTGRQHVPASEGSRDHGTSEPDVATSESVHVSRGPPMVRL
jgi:hypothetical protein